MYNSKNVDPAKQKENTFELYSVPVFPTNTPEIIKGEKLSQIKLSLNKEVYIQTMLMARHQTIPNSLTKICYLSSSSFFISSFSSNSSIHSFTFACSKALLGR